MPKLINFENKDGLVVNNLYFLSEKPKKSPKKRRKKQIKRIYLNFQKVIKMKKSERGGITLVLKDKKGKIKDYFKRTRIKGEGVIQTHDKKKFKK